MSSADVVLFELDTRALPDIVSTRQYPQTPGIQFKLVSRDR